MKPHLQSIIDNLECLNTENITTKRKHRYKDGSREQICDMPDREKAKEMVTLFLTTVDDLGYNASFIDIMKLFIEGAYEHFIYVRIGAFNYYLSEFGLNVIVDMMKDKATTFQLQLRAQNYGVKKTKFARNFLITGLAQHYLDNFNGNMNAAYRYYSKFTEMELQDLDEEIVKEFEASKIDLPIP